MKKMMLLWFAIALLTKLQATSLPEPPPPSSYSLVNQRPFSHRVSTLQRPTLLQKAAARLLERKMQRQIRKGKKRIQDQKRTLGLISMITGIAGAALFVPVLPLGIVLLTIALVTGLIALGNNDDRRSRTHAIIGIIAGGAGIFLLLLFFFLLLVSN